MNKKLIKGVAGAVIAGGAALSAYVLAVRPWHLRWGATDAEVQRSLPGDDLVPDPRWGNTQAITIRASAAEVWPWLVQIGYKRAGWYSHDSIHRLLGVAGSVDEDRRSASRIVPELQHLGIGDSIEIAPGMGYTVVDIEPGRALVLQARIDMGAWRSLDAAEPLPDRYLDSSWVWFLDELDKGVTRLIVRNRTDYGSGPLGVLGVVVPNELGSLVMQPETLRGIKQRAEAIARERGG
jgi:hypothetical protein